MLVRGEKGTAKSTMVRALAARAAADRRSSPAAGSPATRATRTRSARTARIAGRRRRPRPAGPAGRAAGRRHRGPGDRLARPASGRSRTGQAEYEPGLLAARAPRHPLRRRGQPAARPPRRPAARRRRDGPLDVERDGVSVAHAARFVLVGTMNPEEGELRPQLLDRFGLTVEVAAPARPGAARRGGPPPAGLRRRPGRVRRARTPTPEDALGRPDRWPPRRCSAAVVLADAALLKIAEVCAAFEVDGMRADIVIARAAVAHAAWHGRTDGRPGTTSGPPPGWPCRTGAGATRSTRPAWTRTCSTSCSATTTPSRTRPTAAGAPARTRAATRSRRRRTATDRPRRAERSEPAQTARTQRTAPIRPTAARRAARRARHRSASRRRAAVPDRGCSPSAAPARGEAGRRSRALTSSRADRSAPRPTGRQRRLHLAATVRAAAPHQRRRGRTRRRAAGPPRRPAAARSGRAASPTWCCSASTPPGRWPPGKRMEQVKTAVLSLLLDAYQRRDKVGLITFRGAAAELALPPTSLGRHRRRAGWRSCPAGGRTPLAEGLLARRARRCGSSGSATRAAGRCWSSSPTAGPPPGRTRSPGRGRPPPCSRRPASPPWSSTARPGRFRLGLAARLAAHLRRRARAARRGRRRGADRASPSTRGSTGQGRLMPQGQPDAVPDDGLTTRQRRNRPLLIVHTGDGKGKSTAAFGLALRGWNQGWSIGVFQFVKSAKWRIGEQTALERLGRAARRDRRGRPGRVAQDGLRLVLVAQDRAPRTTTPPTAAEGWAEIKRRLAAETHDLLRARRVHLPDQVGLGRRRRRGRHPGRPARPPARHHHRPRADPQADRGRPTWSPR